jgi:hypothetical protein
MLTPILWMFLFQRDPVRPMAESTMTRAAVTRAMGFPEDRDRRVAEAQRRQFELKFNSLVEALARFSDAYRKGQGNVWPLKEAEGIRKAYREMERNMQLGKFPPGTETVR